MNYAHLFVNLHRLLANLCGGGRSFGKDIVSSGCHEKKPINTYIIMKKFRYLFACLLLWAVAMPMFSQVISNDNEDEVYKVNQQMASYDFVPGQVLMKFKDEHRVNIRRVKGKFLSADRNDVNAVLSKFGVEEMVQLLPNEKPGRTLRKAKAFNGDIIAEKDLSQLYCVKLSQEHVEETMLLVEELKALDEVEFAEPNYRLYTLADETICPDYFGNPLNTDQWYLDSYGVKELWNKPIINSERPIIAILDTGVDITHPDLVDNIWTNAAEAEGEEGYDNDHNGFKNDVHGWDFVNQTGTIRDNNLHGTHVAGIAAASNNGIGIVGANPLAYIMPITVMQSDGTGDIATIIKGINYAVANGATILNLSLGSSSNSSALRQSLEKAYQTAVIVAAAGNNRKGIEKACDNEPEPMFPAAYSFVLGVQAIDQNGYLAGFSNYDCNGPNFSLSSDGFNYELKAPGVGILSTIPNGNYKQLNGTSMAAPLVAGAISALKMVKEYDTQEILWGDLTHTDNIAQAYNLTEKPAELDILRLMLRDRKELAEESDEDYSNDGRIDAGETVDIYPVIRTTWGEASNIRLHLEMGDEFEDPNTVEFLTSEADFGLHLDAYGKGVSVNPLQLKVAENVVNNRHIRLKIVATCDGTDTEWEKEFVLIVDNTCKIGGLIDKDLVLTSDKSWLVTSNLAIPEGVTLTIEPGTIVEFDNAGLSNSGLLNINGTPEKPIMLKSHSSDAGGEMLLGDSKLSYCILNNLQIGNMDCNNCIFLNCAFLYKYTSKKISFNKSNIFDGYFQFSYGWSNILNNNYSNYTNYVNITKYYGGFLIEPNKTGCDNIINALFVGESALYSNCSSPKVLSYEVLPYLGSSKESIVRNYVTDIMSGSGYGKFDLSNMPTRPYAEAHGIVWKVVVNGYDAQDEFEQLPPLGVGRHKFEVYFNRPMNKDVAPIISFGVRDPYTQQAVSEDGSWNEEGTIYTAYKTITGKTKSDGLNRIYVYGAEDDEYFEIPYENTRFNIIIQAAGSMATGFAAEAELGRVKLTWNNDDNNFDDAMGFNIYRYTEQTIDNPTRINEEIVDIETTEYTDYEVTPGTTYYYMYKVLSTDLQEYDVSNVVAVTPLTSTKGDANGSGDVDVADVITTVNYAAGQQPKPFIFEAADMNDDLSIDILDIIGIIKDIMHQGASTNASVNAVANYTIEDGIIYVDSPVEVAGVQIQLAFGTDEGLKMKNEGIRVADDMKGFEHTSVWLSDNDYLFLGYNMNGKTLTAGKHAILIIGDAQIADIRLSDAYGHNIIAESSTVDKIDRMACHVMTVSGIYDMQGRKLSAKTDDMKKLPKGVYIVNGEKVVK